MLDRYKHNDINKHPRNKFQKLTQKQDTREFINIYETNKTKKTSYLSQTGGGGTILQQTFGKVYKEIPEEFYAVQNKRQYAQRVRDVRASWINAAIKRKLGKITEKDYILLKSLLKSNLYFARLSLYFSKLDIIHSIFIYGDESILKKIRSIMDKILDIQKEIQRGYFSFESKSIHSDLNPKKINKLLKKQDKLRNQLLEYSLFKNGNDIGKGCYGIGKSFSKSKAFLCILNKYRKYESKFNKYYSKFREQIILFTDTFGCIEPGDKIELEVLDIRNVGSKSQQKFEDKTK